MKALSIRLPDDLKTRLAAAKWDLKKSQNDIVVEAVREFLDRKTPKK